MSAGAWPTIPDGGKPDLDSVEEIAELVRRFYADVAQDDLLAPMFEDVAKVDWSEHLPKLTDFWSRMLLGVEGYTGNPLQAHRRIHRQRAFTDAHFERWLSLFRDTVELGWEGPLARRALELAENVARVHRRWLDGGDGLTIERRATAAASGPRSP